MYHSRSHRSSIGDITPARSAVPSILVTLFICTFMLLAGSAHARPSHGGVAIEPAGTLDRTTIIPDPAECSVTPCDELEGMILAPDRPESIPASRITVTVRNNTGSPIPEAIVTVEWPDQPFLCPTFESQKETDANGVVEFTLAGGGCRVGSLSGVVKANGVTIRVFDNVKSPDYDGVAGNGTVDISDLVPFSSEFLGETPAGCHDYDNNGETNLGDLIIMSPAFTLPSHCP